MAEDRQAKADRYLTEGRVKVREVGPHTGRFEVTGADLYRIVCQGGVWVCNCPARVSVCAHILACQKIASFSIRELTSDPGQTDPQISFLDDLFR